MPESVHVKVLALSWLEDTFRWYMRHNFLGKRRVMQSLFGREGSDWPNPCKRVETMVLKYGYENIMGWQPVDRQDLVLYTSYPLKSKLFYDTLKGDKEI